MEVLTKLLNAQGEDNYTLLHMAARNGMFIQAGMFTFINRFLKKASYPY